MSADAGGSFFYIAFIAVVALQGFAILFFILLWMCRQGASRGKPAKIANACSLKQSRLISFVAGGVLAVTSVAAAYFLLSGPTAMKLEEIPVTAPKKETGIVHSDEIEEFENERGLDRGISSPTEYWKPEKGAEDARIRGITRKALLGKPATVANVRPGLRNTRLHTYIGLINSWLEEESAGGGSSISEELIYDRLVREYDFKGSKTSVIGYLSILKEKSGSGNIAGALFAETDHRCGEEAEVFLTRGEAWISGKKVPVYLFTLRSRWSKVVFVRAMMSIDVKSFIKAHKAAFDFFGGIFADVYYERLPPELMAAVKTTTGKDQKIFSRFTKLYGFEAHFGEKITNAGFGEIYVQVLKSIKANSLNELNKKLAALPFADEQATKEKMVLFETEHLCLAHPPKEALRSVGSFGNETGS